MMRTLQDLVEELEQDPSLYEPSRLRQRIEALDRLDIYHLDAHPSDGQRSRSRAVEPRKTAIRDRAKTLCTKLVAANSKLYETIREDIGRGSRPDSLLEYVSKSSVAGNAATSPQGEGYDYLDDLLSGILHFEMPDDRLAQLEPEMVPYQPTPARHIFDLIARSELTEHDVLIDQGSGLGHVPLLVSICTPARAIGIELEPTYVNCASISAKSLNLKRVTFIHGDARATDLSQGTLFYLYTPFVGTVLRHMLDSLKREATHRKLRICTFGPCTPIVAQEPWLKSASTPRVDQIALFHSR
jgi:predicted RNA methylase